MLITDIMLNVQTKNRILLWRNQGKHKNCNNIKTRICFETFLSSFDSFNTFKLVN